MSSTLLTNVGFPKDASGVERAFTWRTTRSEPAVPGIVLSSHPISNPTFALPGVAVESNVQLLQTFISADVDRYSVPGADLRGTAVVLRRHDKVVSADCFSVIELLEHKFQFVSGMLFCLGIPRKSHHAQKYETHQERAMNHYPSTFQSATPAGTSPVQQLRQRASCATPRTRCDTPSDRVRGRNFPRRFRPKPHRDNVASVAHLP
jgi:hypothetical protein